MEPMIQATIGRRDLCSAGQISKKLLQSFQKCNHVALLKSALSRYVLVAAKFAPFTPSLVCFP
jgi:hypothetical protein